MRKIKCAVWLLLVSLVLSVIPVNARAASELEKAAAFVTEQGIYQGDDRGDLMLDSGLTRAELAVILTRIRGDEGKVKATPLSYSISSHFTDVPQWAKPYVGYCVIHKLMTGYDYSSFGAGDPVTPQAACTVILRHLGYPETDTAPTDRPGGDPGWNYTTAVQKAIAVGIAPAEGLSGAAITRGDFAVIIFRAMTGPQAPQKEEAATPPDAKILDGTSWSREDFSRQANPAVFTDVYTRDAYNAIRQTMVDQDIILAGNNEDGYNTSYRYAHCIGSVETDKAMQLVVSIISNRTIYNQSAEPDIKNLYVYPTYFIVKARPQDTTVLADEATEDIMANAAKMPSSEQIRYFNEIVCDKLEYDANLRNGFTTVFTSPTPVKGACTSYASAFKYLCNRVGIPCLTITSDDHAWNIVYVEGQWLHVDTSLNDVSGNHSALLLGAKSREIDRYPAQTLFMQELLVPGSTQ